MATPYYIKKSNNGSQKNCTTLFKIHIANTHIVYHPYYTFNNIFKWLKNGVYVISQLYFSFKKTF